MSHSGCAKSCSNVLEVFELTLSCSLKHTEPWVRRGRGSCCRSRKFTAAGFYRASYGTGAGDAAAQHGQHGREKRRTAVLACGGGCGSAALKIKKTIELTVKGGKSRW